MRGFAQSSNKPRTIGQRSTPSCTLGLAAPTFCPNTPQQLQHTAKAATATFQDVMNVYNQFSPRCAVGGCGMSTGVPSSASADDDDSSECRTPPVEPFTQHTYSTDGLDLVPTPPPPYADMQPSNQNVAFGAACSLGQAMKRQRQRQQPGSTGKGRQPKMYMASRGSKNHNRGHCRPCNQWNTAEGCPLGATCNFCHYPHDEGKMAELAVYRATAQSRRSRRLVPDEGSVDCTYSGTHEMSMPVFMAFRVQEQATEEPWSASRGSSTTPALAFQRLSF